MPVRRQYQPIGSIVTDVSGARALNVTYTNNTGQVLIVIASFNYSVAAVNDRALVYGLVDGVNVGSMGIFLYNQIVQLITESQLTIVVPIGGTYRFNSVLLGSGVVGITYVIEVQLISPFSAGF